jgi:hypothetical protein
MDTPSWNQRKKEGKNTMTPERGGNKKAKDTLKNKKAKVSGEDGIASEEDLEAEDDEEEEEEDDGKKKIAKKKKKKKKKKIAQKKIAQKKIARKMKVQRKMTETKIEKSPWRLCVL